MGMVTVLLDFSDTIQYMDPSIPAEWTESERHSVAVIFLHSLIQSVLRGCEKSSPKPLVSRVPQESMLPPTNLTSTWSHWTRSSVGIYFLSPGWVSRPFPNAWSLLGYECEGTSLNSTLARPDGHEFTWLWERFVFSRRNRQWISEGPCFSNCFCPSCKIHQGNHALCPIYKAMPTCGIAFPTRFRQPWPGTARKTDFSQGFELQCGGDDYILLWLQFFRWHDHFFVF